MWKISRYWNRFAYLFLDLSRFLAWDYTEKNGQILRYDFAKKDTREIMTKIQ